MLTVIKYHLHTPVPHPKHIQAELNTIGDPLVIDAGTEHLKNNHGEDPYMVVMGNTDIPGRAIPYVVYQYGTEIPNDAISKTCMIGTYTLKTLKYAVFVQPEFSYWYRINRA